MPLPDTAASGIAQAVSTMISAPGGSGATENWGTPRDTSSCRRATRPSPIAPSQKSRASGLDRARA